MPLARQSGPVRLAQAAALLLAVAGTLRLLDWWPRTLAQRGRLRELATIEAVERATGRRVALPAWFPRSLPWPPTRVRVLGRSPDAVALEVTPADAGLPLLVLAQSVRAPVPLPDSLFPSALLLDARPLPWRGGTARLARLRGEDGSAWVELAWEQGGQSFAFRSRGSLEQLLKLAESVRREGP